MKKNTARISWRAGLAGILLAGTLPFFAGCPLGSSALTVARAAPPPSSANPAARSAVPIPEANIKRAVARLPQLVKTVMANTGIPGLAVAVVHDGKTVFAQGFGVRKEGSDAPVTADTVFQIASLSKSISGTVAAKAISDCAVSGSGCEGLSWNTPVHPYLPEFGLSDPWVTRHVTVGDLMAHRSGLPGTAGDLLQILGFDHQQIFSRFAQLPLGPFREQYAYVNFGFSAGAFAVANAVGLDWADLAQRDLFAPLGMDSTSFRYSDYLSRSNRAATHVKRDGKWQALFSFDDDAAAPAGGVSSSVNDLAQWMKLILADGSFSGQQLIQPGVLLPALTPQSTAHPPTTSSTRTGFYGYGVDVNYGMSGRVQLTHSGAFTSGAATAYELIPSADVGIVVLTNAFPIGAAETIASQFSDIVQYGSIRTDWPAFWHHAFGPLAAPVGDCVGQSPPSNPTPPDPDGSYVGTYSSTYFGSVKVTASDGQLTAAFGPKPIRYTLRPWNGNEFVMDLSESDDYEPGSLASVWFTGVSGGAASGLIVTWLNGDGSNGSCSRQPENSFKPYVRD